MKRVLFTVATLSLAYGAFALAGSSKANQISLGRPQVLLMQDHSQAQPETKIFTGTIAKSGEQFVLRDDNSKTAYQLDDQQSAGKFAGRRVRVTGVLDASNNTIRVQSIEAANA